MLKSVSMESHEREASETFERSLRGDRWRSMTANGLLYSSLMGYDSGMAMEAIEMGADGAGLSGTGPALAAVFSSASRAPQKLREEWAADGSLVIEADGNNTQGRLGWDE